jgi:hypothetical protein
MSILDSLFRKVNSALRNEVKDSSNSLQKAIATKTKNVVFDKIPRSIDEFKALPYSSLHDPYEVAALTVVALCRFADDRDASVEMLNHLRGPRPMSPMDVSFIKDRFMDGVDYIPRSYLKGPSPDNDYTPTVPYTVTVKEHSLSRDQYSQGYLRLFLTSSGADSERYLDLRHKPSTDQWFLWEFGGLLSRIRIPKSKDAWA